MSEAHSALSADVLIAADLRGTDSHGVARLPGYVRLWEQGRANMNPVFKIVTETPSTATLDADAALGLVSAQEAMKIAIQKAEYAGTGWVSVRNSNHFGIASYHASLALKKNMIGIAMTNASPLVAPHGGTERMLGTNPICYVFPAGKFQPIVIDLATSSAANGKLEIAERTGKKIPDGWAMDQESHSSKDPGVLKKGGMLLPLGSGEAEAGHKGYALGAMVDILSSILSGANYGPWVPPFVSFLEPFLDLPGKGIGHFLGAMRIDAFRPQEEYVTHIEKWVERFRNSKPLKPGMRVLIPGEPEADIYEKRLRLGIPLENTVTDELSKLAVKMQIEF